MHLTAKQFILALILPGIAVVTIVACFVFAEPIGHKISAWIDAVVHQGQVVPGSRDDFGYRLFPDASLDE